MKRVCFAIILCALSLSTAQAEIIKKDLTYEHNGQSFRGYLAYDNVYDQPRPGVLVVHEWWGHNDYARRRAEMLAQEGYVALALDMYGEGRVTEHPGDAGQFASEVMQDLPEAKMRFEAALETLKSQKQVDTEQIAAIGYCFGGGVVLHMARLGIDLAGVVSFHGSLQNPGELPLPGQIQAKILVCHGGDDEFIPAAVIKAFHSEMRAAEADYQFKVYPGAAHSFTNPMADQFGETYQLPLAYDQDADLKSWQDMLGFFQQIFDQS